jgi:hypothetical protein
MTTVEILREHRARHEERVAALGAAVSEEAFVFSLAPDSSSFLIAESVTQRYGRLVERLDIETSLHALRHYSATEMISAGVDVRTVAGRLGHSGGGITTLRVYSAWRDEADQRAAAGFSIWMPDKPAARLEASERAKEDPRNPYEMIASELRGKILAGQVVAGAQLPTVRELAETNNVSVSTVKRSFTLLVEWGLIEVSRGRRATVRQPQEHLE